MSQIGPKMRRYDPVKRSQMDRRRDSLTDNYRVPAEWSPNKLSTCINNYIEGSKVTILYTSPTPAFHVLVGINMQISPSHDYHLQKKVCIRICLKFLQTNENNKHRRNLLNRNVWMYIYLVYWLTQSVGSSLLHPSVLDQDGKSREHTLSKHQGALGFPSVPPKTSIHYNVQCIINRCITLQIRLCLW